MKRVILFLIFCVLLSANEGYAQIQEILKQQDTTVTVLSKKEQKRLKKELEQKHEQTKEKKDNFISLYIEHERIHFILEIRHLSDIYEFITQHHARQDFSWWGVG